MKNFIASDWYLERQDRKAYIYTAPYLVSEDKIQLFRDFEVLIRKYTRSGNKNGNFEYNINCTEFTIIESETNAELFTIRPDYRDTFEEQLHHANGDQYFICGNDLLEYYVCNLSKRTVKGFLSGFKVFENYSDKENSDFYYIDGLIYNPANNLIAFNGVEGMGGRIVMLGDFSSFESLSFLAKNISYLSEEDRYCYAAGWTEDDKLILELGEGKSKTIFLTEKEQFELIQPASEQT